MSDSRRFVKRFQRTNSKSHASHILARLPCDGVRVSARLNPAMTNSSVDAAFLSSRTKEKQWLRTKHPRGFACEGERVFNLTAQLHYLLVAAGVFVLAGFSAGGEVWSPDGLQPTRSANSGSSIRIFFICF